MLIKNLKKTKIAKNRIKILNKIYKLSLSLI